MRNMNQQVNDEIVLIDVMRIVWRRKWLVLVAVVVAMGAAALFAQTRPVKYTVTTAFQTAKDNGGKPVESIDAYRLKVVNGEYLAALAEQLQIDEEQLPTLSATVPRKASYLVVKVQVDDIATGVAQLDALNQLVLADMGPALELAQEPLQHEIELGDLKQVMCQKHHERLLRRLNVATGRLKELQALQRQITNDADLQTQLYYFTIIGEQQRQIVEIQEKISADELKLAQLAVTQENLQLKLDKFKPPTVRTPPKMASSNAGFGLAQILVMAGLLGAMIGILLALLVEYLKKVRDVEWGMRNGG